MRHDHARTPAPHTPTRRLRLPALLALAGLMALTAACGGRHHLDDYDFARSSLAVVHFGAPAPELRTGGYRIQTDDPIGAVVSAGGRMARELEARRARARLDSASQRIDLAARMAERTLERASRYLGARPVDDRASADYLLEVDVRRIGLDARSDRVYLFVVGEAVLLDAGTGREIWDADVSGSDRLTSDLVDDPLLEDILGAGALSTLSTDELERVLTRLADYAADRIVRELRGDLRDVRDG